MSSDKCHVLLKLGFFVRSFFTQSFEAQSEPVDELECTLILHSETLSPHKVRTPY